MLLASVMITGLISCNDLGLGKGECEGANEFLDRFNTIDAHIPDITTQPAGGRVAIGAPGDKHTLTVSASVRDGGTLTYQWYMRFISGSITGWMPIDDATDSTYDVRSDSLAIYNFYVEVINTNNRVKGSKKASISSDSITLSITSIVNAQKPHIINDPAGVTTVTIKEDGTYPLSVTASVQSGTLSYQWFRAQNAQGEGGVPVNGDTNSVFNAPIDSLGTFYYYVVVTNTIPENNDGGTKTASITSETAALIVNDKRNALNPVINTYPGDTTVMAGSSLTLTVSASAADGDGVLSYTWYRTESRTSSGGVEVGSGRSFTVPTTAKNTFFYYCLVTNTIPEGDDTGETTAQARGGSVRVIVNEADDAHTYTLKVTNPGAGGTLSVNGESELELTGLQADAPINILAESAQNYVFVSWTITGGVTLTNDNGVNNPVITFDMPANEVNVTANFILRTYKVTFIASSGLVNDHNTVVMDVQHGKTLESLSLSAEKSGFTFNGWFSNTTGGTKYPGDHVFVRSDTLYAQWIHNVSLNVSSQNSNHGTVTAPHQQNPPGVSFNISAPPNTVITILAQPKDGYRFTKWTTILTLSDGTPVFADSTSANTTVTITGNADIMANFVRTYTLTVECNITAGGNICSSAAVQFDSDVASDISAVPADGYKFFRWTVVSGEAAIDSAYNMDAKVTLKSNATIRADFYEPLYDSRDSGREYRTVLIGGKTWMAENLNYSGSPNDVGVCYGNFSDNCDLYGRLYRWHEVMAIDSKYDSTSWGGSDVGHQGICPKDWRVPSDADWDDLMISVGGVRAYGYWDDAGMKLKSQSGWSHDGNGTDEFGFSALPGGYRFANGNTREAGVWGHWWSASEHDTGNAGDWIMSNRENSVTSRGSGKDTSFSLRCIKN